MRSLVMLLLLVASLNARADEPCFSVGADLASSLTAEYTRKPDSLDGATIEYRSFIKAFNVGVCFPENNRFLLSQTAIDVDGSRFKRTFKGYDIDWQIVYRYRNLMPYWSLGAGYYEIEGGEDDINGPSLNLAGGLKFPVHRHVELDASLRFREFMWNAYESEDLGTVRDSGRILSLSVGAAFRF